MPIPSPEPRPDPVRYDDLSLADVARLSNLLDALQDAGMGLQEAGYVVRFALYPGAAPRLTVVGVAMPHAPVVAGYGSGPMLVHGADRGPDPVPAPDADPVPEPDPAPAEDPGPAPGAGTPDRQADPVPAPEPAAPLPPLPEPAPAAGGASAPWTDEEDATAIRMRRGGATIAAIAAALGRPEPGTNFRFRNKLADWATRPGVPAAPRPAPGADPGSPDAVQAVVLEAALEVVPEADPAPAPVLPAPAPKPVPPDLVRVLDHLAALRADSTWKAGDDQELMRLTDLRWPVGDVAAEIGWSVEMCKARHRLLTGGGLFPAEQVLAALRLKHGEA